MGDSRKYPYPTTGGMSILTPPCPRKFQNTHPLLALRIPTLMYGRLLLLPASVVRSCLIHKLGKLTSPLSDFKRSFRRPLELQTALPPHAFGIPLQETPLSLGIPRCRPWYGMDIFWNHPIQSTVHEARRQKHLTHMFSIFVSGSA